MKIWIDIATSPQVLFLRPIIAELEKRGYELLITTRHSTETVPLANRYNLQHTVVGAHGGGTLAGKGTAIAFRAIKLMAFVRHHAISLAVSHSSFSQALAAGILRIPLITFDDYEGHPATHILCRVTKKVFVPDIFDKTSLYRYGASEDKVEAYHGLKENVYLADFVPDPAFLDTAGIPSERIVVTMRPPNLVASYHRLKNPFFDDLLAHILSYPNTFVVLLPRGSEQRRRYKEAALPNTLIPNRVLDGPNLIYHSDLVVGAGGTMNREATVLSTPVYTVFRGKMGSIDQNLIRSGKMVHLKDQTDFSKIKICKKSNTTFALRQKEDLLDEVVNKILGENSLLPMKNGR